MEAGLTTGAATGVLNRLEKAGYLHRGADPQDQTRQAGRVTTAYRRTSAPALTSSNSFRGK